VPPALIAHTLFETASTSGTSVIQILLAALAGGGGISAAVALLKLKPENNTAAVTQSKGAMETMAILNEQLESERNEWRERALAAENKLQKLQAELSQLKARLT
jgi:hypothetical protein